MYSVCICFFFFFKQKTAYEMRISDWSSDVCSSDLLQHLRHHAAGAHQAPDMLDRLDAAELHEAGAGDGVDRLTCRVGNQVQMVAGHHPASARREVCARSEEHTSELQSLMRISYAVFCLKKKKKK